jgi:serine/threonine protein kinase
MSMKEKKRFQIFGPYRLGQTIGQGEFGKVKLGYHLESNLEVAIKFVKKEVMSSKVKQEKLAREIGILQVSEIHIVFKPSFYR